MKLIVSSFILFGFLTANCQTIKIKATQGDGIYSLLRKQGLDPIKYYGDFIELNQDHLKNGSELYLGREYIIPDAPDSYKKMGLRISGENMVQKPLFEEELATIAPKSQKLKDAVIYLLPGQNEFEKSKNIALTRDQIIRGIAQELMVHGAKVMYIENTASTTTSPILEKDKKQQTEKAIADQEQLQQYVEIINKEYLKNIGKYQRILVINLNESARHSKYFDISLLHHGNSEDGQRFAKNLELLFNENSVHGDQKYYTKIFAHSGNLFLAKNVLPAITMIDIGNTKNPSIEDRISIAAQDEVLTHIVTGGVLTDYANLSMIE